MEGCVFITSNSSGVRRRGGEPDHPPLALGPPQAPRQQRRGLSYPPHVLAARQVVAVFRRQRQSLKCLDVDLLEVSRAFRRPVEAPGPLPVLEAAETDFEEIPDAGWQVDYIHGLG